MSALETKQQNLLKRITAFCGSIGDGVQRLDAKLVSRIRDVMRRLKSPAKVVIAGRANADHRRLAEFFLGTDMFPPSAEPCAYPLIQIRHGKTPMTHTVYGDKKRSFDGLCIAEAIAEAKPIALEIEAPNSITAQIEFTLLPDFDGEEEQAKFLLELIDATDIVIWCSDAKSIWTPEERAIWSTVPGAIKDRSLIAMTAADQIDSDVLIASFDEKCASVADDFHSIVALAVQSARNATPNGRVIDAGAFELSGGKDLLRAFIALVESGQKALIEDAYALCGDLDKVPLGRTGKAPVPLKLKRPPHPKLRNSASPSIHKERAAIEPVPAKPAPSPHDLVHAFLSDQTQKCVVALEARDKGGYANLFEEMIALLSGLSRFVREGLKLQAHHDVVVDQLEEAEDIVGLLSYEGDDRAAHEAADIIRQISIDFWTALCSDPNEASTPFLTEIERDLATG